MARLLTITHCADGCNDLSCRRVQGHEVGDLLEVWVCDIVGDQVDINKPIPDFCPLPEAPDADQ